MDLAALQMFQMVASERSYSRAAVKLFRTQPAISIAMRKLEDWVGQPLFVRGSGARTLTDAGTLLLEYSSRMLNMREEIRKGLQELRGLERGQLSLGVNESSIHALLPALEQYRRLHPGIHIRVHRVFSREVPRELLNHQLDIGVISYLPEERELTTAEFYRDALVLVVWPGHRLAKRKDVDITALGEETFVAHIVESPYRHRVVQLFAKYKVPLRMEVELPTIESIKRFVEMKKGVAIVPRMCVEGELARGDLRELRIKQMHFERKLYLVYRQDRPLTAAARALVDIILPLKKAPRHDAGFEFVAQQLAESVGVPAGELRKRDRPRFRPDRQQISAALEKFLQQRAVRCEHLLRARGNLRQMLQSEHAEQFDGMRRHHSEQVVQPPHAFRQRLRRENPAAAQPR